MPKLCSGERMYVWCMYVHVCVCVCVCVCVQISSLKPLGQLKAGYVYNDYTSCTPGCVTDMVNELGWESLEDRCQISRLCHLYKTHHGLVDIDKTAFLKEHTKHEVHYNSFFPRKNPGIKPTAKQCNLINHSRWLPC